MVALREGVQLTLYLARCLELATHGVEKQEPKEERNELRSISNLVTEGLRSRVGALNLWDSVTFDALIGFQGRGI